MNSKNARPERPDKTLFKLMMAVFFLLFALAPAYWAFYNYGNYVRTEEWLRQSQEQRRAAPKDAYVGDTFHFESVRAERYRFEMFLSAAGAALLFGISMLLFVTAYAGRGRKNFYRRADWQNHAPPVTRLEVRYTKFQTFLLAGLSAFFAFLSAFVFYQTLTGAFSTTREIIVKGAFCLFAAAIMLTLVFLEIRARRRAVVLFDASGVTRGDGRHFAWEEFCGVIVQTARNRFGRRYVWRDELAFANGETAWIIPGRVANAHEVFEFFNSLPRAEFQSSDE